jgi:hypothetical protein
MLDYLNVFVNKIRVSSQIQRLGSVLCTVSLQIGVSVLLICQRIVNVLRKVPYLGAFLFALMLSVALHWGYPSSSLAEIASSTGDATKLYLHSTISPVTGSEVITLNDNPVPPVTATVGDLSPAMETLPEGYHLEIVNATYGGRLQNGFAT